MKPGDNIYIRKKKKGFNTGTIDKVFSSSNNAKILMAEAKIDPKNKLEVRDIKEFKRMGIFSQKEIINDTIFHYKYKIVFRNSNRLVYVSAFLRHENGGHGNRRLKAYMLKNGKRHNWT